MHKWKSWPTCIVGAFLAIKVSYELQFIKQGMHNRAATMVSVFSFSPVNVENTQVSANATLLNETLWCFLCGDVLAWLCPCLACLVIKLVIKTSANPTIINALKIIDKMISTIQSEVKFKHTVSRKVPAVLAMPLCWPYSSLVILFHKSLASCDHSC